MKDVSISTEYCLIIKVLREVESLKAGRKVAGLNGQEIVQYLNQKPFIRLSWTDPEHVFGFMPKTNSDFLSDGVIGVRTGVANGIGWSCLPSYSLISHLKNKKGFICVVA